MKPMNREQELEEEFKQLMEQAVYDCDTDEQGHKVKRCNRCMYNAGRTTTGTVICTKEP